MPKSSRLNKPTPSKGKGKVFSSSQYSNPKTSKLNSSSGLSKKEASEAAYLARQARKNPALDIDPSEIFDFEAGKHHRSSVGTDLTREEESGSRDKVGRARKTASAKKKSRQGDEMDEEHDEDEDNDEEDEVDEDAIKEKIRKMVAGNDDGIVLSEDDEDIDSDDAWEEGAEDQMDWSTAFVSKKSAPEWKEVDEEEANYSTESDDEEGADFLANLLDSDAEAEGSSNSSVDGMDDDEDEEDGLSKLGSLIGKLSSSKGKRKADEDDNAGDEAKIQKRRVLKDRGEDGRREGEFGAPLTTASKLSLATLLQPLSNSPSSSTSALLKSLAPAPLAAPLGLRAQDKLSREAAYEQTKSEVDKWGPSMKRIKEAEYLSFPLQAQPKPKASAAELSSKFKPTNDLESAVSNLLATAQMSEQSLAKSETLAMANLTMEEVQARRSELARMRELMFRAETKAKRVAKIKSKAYRKIAKKDRLKTDEKLREAGLLDDEEEAHKAERERARERATLRHKNTGKWAKSMLERESELDVDQRRELHEQLNRGEDLKKKIQGYGNESDEEDDDDIDDPEEARRRAFDELDRVDDSASDEFIDVGGSSKKKGLMEMKFMKDAMARNMAKVGEESRAAREALEKLGILEDGVDSDLESEDEGAAQKTTMTNVGGNSGRMVFSSNATSGLKSAPAPYAKPPSESSFASSHTLQSSLPHQSPPLNESEDTESNPWLATAPPSVKIARKNNIVGSASAKSGADKSALGIRKSLAKVEEAKEREREDAMVQIDFNDISVGHLSSKKGKGRVVSDNAIAEDDDDDDDDEVHYSNGTMAFKQRDLVAEAFAADNVVEEFAEQKRREQEADAPMDEDITLPGWGNWGGKGVKKNKNAKKFIKHVPGLEVSKRRDFGRANVIISERKDKKVAKYQTKDLPYPYTSAAQYEASLSLPIGTEWSTRNTHQKLTMPRVTKKMGAIIDPLAKLY